MILTTENFKELYDIELSDVKILNAIQLAEEFFFNLISLKQELKTQQSYTDSIMVQLQNWYPLTKDISIEIQPSDIELIEYDSDYNVIDQSSHITGANFIKIDKDNRLKILIDTQLPATSGNMFIVRFYMTRIDLSNQQKVDSIRRILALKTFNFLSKDILISLNQNGITEWSLNGVSVRADNDGIKSLIENNNVEIKDIYDNIMPLAIVATKSRQSWLGSRYGRY